jgi:divinyl protochlorophyllide a 8-vinyl-reductase
LNVAAMVAATAGASAARIGPNAVTRVGEALRQRFGERRAGELFERAGLTAYTWAPPVAMIDEGEVIRLHQVLRADLGAPLAREVAREAGRLTADYLLERRIPRAAQFVLRRLPAPLAASLLLATIRRHAWTFSGSGRFAIAQAPSWQGRAQVSIAGNPLCRGVTDGQPGCDYYAGTLERLFRVLVHPATDVVEVACEASGAAACVFEFRWSARRGTS